jgi:hypothetical protein
MHAINNRPRRLGAALLVLAVASMIVVTGLPSQQKAQAAYSDPDNYVIGLHTPCKINKLIYPTIGNPNIVKRGGSFTIEWDPREGHYYDNGTHTYIPQPACTSFVVTLTSTNGGNGAITRSYSIADADVTTAQSDRWPKMKNPLPLPGTNAVYKIPVTIPESLPLDLYDLTINCTIDGTPGFIDTQTNAVNVIQDFKTDYNFVQMTDIHVYGPENPNASIFYSHSQHERSARRTVYDANPNGVGYGATYLHKEVMEINRLHPDFCIFTGDYDFGQRYFQQDEGSPWGNCTQYEFEQEWFYQEMQKLEVPVFIVIGNHDGYYYNTDFSAPVDQDWLVNWTKMYSPLYFKFNYGPSNVFYGVNTMDWSTDQRSLQNFFNLILQPIKYLGEILSGGDTFASGIDQSRLNMELNTRMPGYTQELGWLRDQLAADQSAASRVMVMHHDPWKDNGSGSMWASSDNQGIISQVTGILDMGNGEGRIALIALATRYKVNLIISGHDHSDCTSEDDSNKALLYWTGTDGSNGQHTISANTTSASFQADGTDAFFPGYRRVWINNGQVVTSGNENLNYQDPFYSWPAYKGTTVGGNTNLNNLSVPAFQQNWTATPGPGTEDVTCTLSNNYNKPVAGNYLEFPMKVLSGGYYYQVTNGTWGETFDVTEHSTRMNQVYTDLAAGQQNKGVRVYKSAAPDSTAPTGSVTINGGDSTTASKDVTLALSAYDSESGVAEMQISNDPAFAGAIWEPYRTDKIWNLGGADTSGDRTVYVKYRDRSMPGNERVVTDSIYYEYRPPAAPNIHSVNPNNGDRGYDVSVVMTGENTHFVQGTTSAVFTKTGGSGITLNATVVQSPTQCRADIHIAATATMGQWDVGCTNGAETVQPLHNGFTINGPAITGITPTFGAAGTTLSVNITKNGLGQGFIQGTSMVKFYRDGALISGSPSDGKEITISYPPGCPPGNCTVTDATHCTASITISRNATAGPCDVTVNTAGEAVPLSGGFTITTHDPRIVSVSPESGLLGTTLDVAITGADTAFAQGTSVASFGSGITVHSTTVTNPTHATANITISAGATVGTRNVNVNTGSESPDPLLAGFAVERDGPLIYSIAPTSGVNTGTVHITNLAGQNFQNGVTVKLMRSGLSDIVATNVVRTGTTKITCDFNINGATIGPWDVVVTNTDNKFDSLGGGFTVVYPAPTVSAITPNSGLDTDNPKSIENLAGTNFKVGATVKLTKTGQADVQATNVIVVNSTKITCDFDLTSKRGGAWNVVVTNIDAQSATLANGFSVHYANPPGTLLSSNPTAGQTGTVVTGVAVTGSGSHFKTGAQVKLTKTGSPDVLAAATLDGTTPETLLTCDLDLSGISSGYGKLWVVNDDGQVSGNYLDFHVDPAPHPIIDTVSPGVGPVGTTVTLTGSLFGASRGSGGTASTVTFNGTAATVYTAWSDAGITCKVPSGATSGSIRVVTVSGTSNVDKSFTVTGTAPVTPTVAPTRTWYLAEGTSDYGFDTYINIMNPNSTVEYADVSYMTKTGLKTRPKVKLQPMSQTVINPRNDIGVTDFSTKVTCEKDKSICVDRRMTWRGQGAPTSEGHASVGVTAPARTWYLAEGSSKWGFESWLLIQNPNGAVAHCQVTYMVEGVGPKTVAHNVPANSRASFSMADDIGSGDASIKVVSDQQVIPERSMYRNNRREGHNSIGTTTPSADYYLAEGTTDWGFTTFVLVQNPNSKQVTVNVTYMTPVGPVAQTPFTMAANSRKTINVNELVSKKDLSIKVHGSAPIIAERAMYWGAGTALGESCHDSIGMSAPHMTFFMPDGETYNGTETWTLVQNPNSQAVSVEITYLTSSGTSNPVIKATIKANSRQSFNMSDKLGAGRAGVLVKSKTAGKAIMVERSMYWNSRGGGTDTIGGCSD